MQWLSWVLFFVHLAIMVAACFMLAHAVMVSHSVFWSLVASMVIAVNFFLAQLAATGWLKE